jgi:hypothetical protein
VGFNVEDAENAAPQSRKQTFLDQGRKMNREWTPMNANEEVSSLWHPFVPIRVFFSSCVHPHGVDVAPILPLRPSAFSASSALK